MKQIIKSLGMAVAIAFCSVNASAQFFGGEGGPQRMSVEEMAKTQGTSIAKGLKLKKAETKKFVATYTEYQKELQLLRRSMEPQDRKERRDRRRSNHRGNDGQQRPPRQMGAPTDSVPTPPDTIAPGAPADPDSVNARRMNTRQRMVRHGEPSVDMKQKMAVMQEKTKALREKYAAIYAEYLSPEQIAKIYELEKKAEEQRRQEMRLRFEQMRQMNGPMGGGNRGGGWGGGDF
mgnify:CR=1 FL=1